MGFAACIEANPIRPLGAPITHQSCGTHTPIADPGNAFDVTVDVFAGGQPWGSYVVSIVTAKVPWLDLQGLPPVADCGLLYTLAFRIGGIAAASGNARTDPLTDTGDAGLADQGVAAIVAPPPGTAWGSDT